MFVSTVVSYNYCSPIRLFFKIRNSLPHHAFCTEFLILLRKPSQSILTANSPDCCLYNRLIFCILTSNFLAIKAKSLYRKSSVQRFSTQFFFLNTKNLLMT